MKNLLSVSVLLTILFSSGDAQDTVQVKTGWNIIGSVEAGAIPDVLSTIPDSIITSSFFGYDPDTGYQSTDILGKGLGYWVKVKAGGFIIFNTSTATDSCKSKAFIYQGKFYNTVKIGDQCWTAENLDVGTMVDSLVEQVDNDTLEKYCYNNDPLYCTLYGGLYQWDEAMQYVATPGTRGVCPPGWHIPTYAEFETLSSAVGGDGNVLKALGQGAGAGAGTNTSGFSAMLAGSRGYYGNFFNSGYVAYSWSSTENDAQSAVYLSLHDGDGNFSLEYDYAKISGFSVRCLEN